MRLVRAFLMVLVLISVGRVGAQAEEASGPQGITLQEAVAVALKNNPTAQAADAYAQAVEQGIAQARAGHLPRIDFSEGFTRGNNPVYVFGSLLTQRQFTARNFELGFLNTLLPLNNFRTQFSAAMPLFDAGTSRRVRDARLEAQNAAQERERTRQEVIFNVIRAYLDELLARETVRVAETALAAATSDAAHAGTTRTRSYRSIRPAQRSGAVGAGAGRLDPRAERVGDRASRPQHRHGTA